MKIIWSALAVERLEETCDHIARESPAAAQRWAASILDLVDLLRANPQTVRVVPELGIAAIRELISGRYRIIYRTLGPAIRILTVRSFSQPFPSEDVPSQ